MNMQELKSLIYQGEKVDIECKKAEGNIPKSVYESYSAFANTKGGYIILGVLEDKSKSLSEERYIIKGVQDPGAQKEDFWNTINGNKVNVNVLKDEDVFNFFSKITPKLTEDLPKPFKLEGIQRIDETPLHKAVREAFVNLIIHADYLMDAGTLKVIKKNKSFEFTNPGILKLPVEDIFRGGNSKPRNSHMQTMLRMVGFGDNAGSGFPTIVAAWDAEGWVKPELIEDTILNQVTLKLDMVKAESVVKQTTAVTKSSEEDEKSIQDKVIEFCKESRTLAEIMEHLGFTSRSQFKKHYFNKMITGGLLKRTIPDKPSSPKQQYYS